MFCYIQTSQKIDMAGRKPKYTNDLLICKLEEYIKKHPFKEIKFTDLAKELSVPAYIWRDNAKVRSLIEKSNNSPLAYVSKKEAFVFPSAEELVESNINNKSRLIKVIQGHLNIMNDIYEKAELSKTFVQKEQSYLNEIKEKDATIRKLEKKNEELRREIDKLYIHSESANIRDSLGLKDNLIKLVPNSKKLSKDLNDIKASFSSIFDESN